MKHRKFVKQLMAAGVTRNRANDILAYEARLLGIPYFKYAGQFLNDLGVTHYRLDKNMQALGLTLPGGRAGLANSMRLRPVVYMTTNNPYIKPLSITPTDGLRADFVAIDEVHRWPKENPHLGGGKA